MRASPGRAEGDVGHGMSFKLSTAFRKYDPVFARQASRSGAGNVAGGKREARNPR
jgi:hypothetical protein